MLNAYKQVSIRARQGIFSRVGERLIETGTIVLVPQHDTDGLLTGINDHFRRVAASGTADNSITVWSLDARGGDWGFVDQREEIHMNALGYVVHGLTHTGIRVEGDVNLRDECGRANSLHGQTGHNKVTVGVF